MLVHLECIDDVVLLFRAPGIFSVLIHMTDIAVKSGHSPQHFVYKSHPAEYQNIENITYVKVSPISTASDYLPEAEALGIKHAILEAKEYRAALPSLYSYYDRYVYDMEEIIKTHKIEYFIDIFGGTSPRSIIDMINRGGGTDDVFNRIG